MLFGDGIVLLAQDETQLQQRVYEWQREIKRNGQRLNARTTVGVG